MFEGLPQNDADCHELELLKTRLHVHDGELVRVNRDGGVIMRLPLREIQHVGFGRQLNPVAVLFWPTAAALAAIGQFVSRSNVLSVLLYVSAVLVALLGSTGLVARRIVIRSTHGEAIRIVCEDEPDEGYGFVVSLRRQIR